jgi:hypothetical protein
MTMADGGWIAWCLSRRHEKHWWQRRAAVEQEARRKAETAFGLVLTEQRNLELKVRNQRRELANLHARPRDGASTKAAATKRTTPRERKSPLPADLPE